MKIFQVVTLLFIVGMITIGCTPSNQASTKSDDPELTVYTTVYPFQYVVEQIGGDTVSAKSVFPPGADAHTYEPTSKEMTAIAKSDAFIYLGAGMEGFAEGIADALGSQDVKLIEIGKHEDLFHGHSHKGHDHENKDEHNHGEEGDDHGKTDVHGHEEGNNHADKSIAIEGLQDHYHTGDTIELTASPKEESGHNHWHWYILNPDAKDWETVSDQLSNTYKGEAVADSQQIKAILFDEDHNVIAESEPVTIAINDHHGHNHEHDEHGEEAHDHGSEDHEHGRTEKHDHKSITIEGLRAHYHTGDTIELTAAHSNESGHNHWHWYTLNPDAKDWETVSGQLSNTYKGETATNGQQIKAALFDENHNVIAESDPVTIVIDDHTGGHDPHIWIDPLRMIEVSKIIRDELIALNPDEEARYSKNFKALKKELIALDKRYQQLLETKENKHIIVPHAAFGYWEERYGVKQIAISGLSTSEEPSQKELKEVIEQAEKFDLDYILYEQNSPNRLSEVIQEQIGAEALTIHNLSVLTKEDIKNNKDYISLMDKNLKILDQVTK
ncbi:hypothetical protein GCM10011409_27400 [Lentibacillus populi]|uniref:Mn2+/Zn2+ ABC transporter substrate-binding protein n=1 Tax=Lentibacillus populi TaxID=1827502 RepID=A0A9W5TYY1_9BACI|nr:MULTISPECIES: zinc ABC transporter substrate-binding protein [Bacillaceae]MBT2215626.1 zinc ABC transporter substrate-binding protein [Virgibacillus dakarensis]GGB48395.1 hypothetical protein GCM10011409_27400 [Lentibacillus populi]